MADVKRRMDPGGAAVFWFKGGLAGLQGADGMLAMMTYRTLNPTTEELLESYPLTNDDELERVLAASAVAFESWSDAGFQTRGERLIEIAELLDARAPELARLMAVEMGKPVAEGRAEASKCAWSCRHFAERAAELLARDSRSSDGAESWVQYEPLGPVLGVMPWNFPLWQFFRFAAPALMAGNTVILKHAPNTPQCALAIVGLANDAAFPQGVIQSVFLSNEQTAQVIADPRICGVTLTGSTRAGQQIGAVSGAALKPTVMELGGSDPFIVFPDADLEQAVDVGVQARCLNSGQSCIAAKRFLIHRSVYADFVDRFVQQMQARVFGDPLEGGVDIGPLARRDLLDQLDEQVRRSLAAGAEAHCGGAPHDGRGFFYPPTVLSGVEPDSPAAREELFGPVAALASFRNEQHAVELANASRYGLGASVWTADLERGRSLAAELEVGSVFINGLVKSDPRLPFGGIKDSGFGRELGREGILEFVNAKTVWIG